MKEAKAPEAGKTKNQGAGRGQGEEHSSPFQALWVTLPLQPSGWLGHILLMPTLLSPCSIVQ